MPLTQIARSVGAATLLTCSVLLSNGATAQQLGQLTDARHLQLAQLEGRWDVTQSEWKSPEAPPSVDRGRATLSVVLGRHLQQRLRIDADKPFEGLGYIGYDDASGKYFSTWMDINFSGIIFTSGDWSSTDQSYTFRGDVPDGKGGLSHLRAVMHVLDRDHFSYEYYEARGGREALVIRLDYVRAN